MLDKHPFVPGLEKNGWKKHEILMMCQASLFILSSLFLVAPRFFPRTCTANDFSCLFHFFGCFAIVLSLLIHRALLLVFSTQIPLIPFCLLILQAVGHGAHSAMNNADRNELLSFCHYSFSLGEFLLLSWHFSSTSSSPQSGTRNRIFTFCVHMTATVHGLAAAALAVGTRTVPALLPTWLTIFSVLFLSGSKWKKRYHLRSYGMVFGFYSLVFVGFWAFHHRGLPTFDDLIAESPIH
jgi:hypothetical protein